LVTLGLWWVDEDDLKAGTVKLNQKALVELADGVVDKQLGAKANPDAPTCRELPAGNMRRFKVQLRRLSPKEPTETFHERSVVGVVVGKVEGTKAPEEVLGWVGQGSRQVQQSVKALPIASSPVGNGRLGLGDGW
jgi:hypothetical protein